MSKTVALDPAEWKALALTGVAQLHTFYSGISAPTTQDLQTISAQLDRMRAFALAWHLSQNPVVERAPVVHRAIVEAANPVVDQPVGDIPGEKRKGGWPKGKKRIRNGVQLNNAT